MQPLGCTGYRYDEISGNYFAQTREYDPLAGRFTSRDNERFIHPANNNSLNLYAYCQGNPMRFVDPLGFDVVALSSGNSDCPIAGEVGDRTSSGHNRIAPIEYAGEWVGTDWGWGRNPQYYRIEEAGGKD